MCLSAMALAGGWRRSDRVDATHPGSRPLGIPWSPKVAILFSACEMSGRCENCQKLLKVCDLQLNAACCPMMVRREQMVCHFIDHPGFFPHSPRARHGRCPPNSSLTQTIGALFTPGEVSAKHLFTS
jgi:hypothetical protein